MSWLNEVARMNMYCMSVTCEVSHALMAWLNERRRHRNMWAVFVTCDVFHEPIG